jgi:hypothetical protein
VLFIDAYLPLDEIILRCLDILVYYAQSQEIRSVCSYKEDMDMNEVGKQYCSISYYARYGENKVFDRDGKKDEVKGDGQYEQFVLDGLKTELQTPLKGIEDPNFKKFLSKKVLKDLKEGSTIKVGQDDWKVDKAGITYTIEKKDIIPAMCMGAIFVPLIYAIERLEGMLGGGLKELKISSKAQCVDGDFSSPASHLSVLYSGEKYSSIYLSSRFKDGEFVEDHIISSKFNLKTGEFHKDTLEENGSSMGYR